MAVPPVGAAPATLDPLTEAPAPLAAVAGRAFGWSFANTVVSRLGTLAIGVLLARTLGPASFGTFAVATVAMMAVLSINELGVSLAIVRWREDPASIAPTVTTVSALSSLVLFGLMVASAGAFATAMGDASAAPVVRLMAVAVLVNGLVATPAALLQRNFQQGRRLVVDQVNTWLGAVVSLLLALAGMGAMSLAIGRVTGSVVSGILFLRWSPMAFRFGFHRPTARALLRFGLPLAGSSLIVFAVGYADQLVAGTMLGATTLGFYVLAFNLASWPVTIFSAPLRSVAPAAFARLQEDRPRMAHAFGEVLQLLTAVALPVCLLVAGAAAPIVHLVYGGQWAPAAAALAFLGVAAAARIFFELAYDFLVVVGRSGPILVVQAVWVAVLVPALVVGAHLGRAARAGVRAGRGRRPGGRAGLRAPATTGRGDAPRPPAAYLGRGPGRRGGSRLLVGRRGPRRLPARRLPSLRLGGCGRGGRPALRQPARPPPLGGRSPRGVVFVKVLVYPHDLGMGGSQTNAIEIAAAMRPLGVEPIVFGQPGTLCHRIEQLGLEFVASPPPGPRPSPRVALRLRTLARTRKLDVLHGYEWPPGPGVRGRGRRRLPEARGVDRDVDGRPAVPSSDRTAGGGDRADPGGRDRARSLAHLPARAAGGPGPQRSESCVGAGGVQEPVGARARAGRSSSA